MLRKLMIIIMGIYLVICAGACNLYPLYLKIMMDKFNFSIKQVNLYGTFINLGLWVALPMGWIYDALGPKFSCIIGAIFLSGSYFALHILFNSDLNSVSILLFLLIALIMGQGSALCFTTSVTTNLKNFRFKESSAIVGLLVANMALSPSVFTTYREAMKDVKTPNFFMIIAIFILIVVIICTFVFHNIRRVYMEDEEKKTYQKYKEKQIIKFLIYLNILILIVYTFGVIFHSVWEDDSRTSKFPLIIIYPCLQLFNFVVVIFEHYGLFDKMYFRPYIDKMIVKHINLNNGNIYKINDHVEKKEIKLDKNKNEGVKEEINNKNTESDLKVEGEVIDGGFTEVQLNTDLVIDSSISEMYIGSKNDKKESILSKDDPNNNNNVSISSSNNSTEALADKDIINISPTNDINIANEDNINVSFKEAILSENVIILFIILFLGVGSEISNLNNIEFIVLSLSKNPQSGIYTNTTNYGSSDLNSTVTPTYYPTTHRNSSKSNIIYSYVILYFVFNSFTRIISGLILDHLIKIKKFFYYLVLITILGLISQMLGIFMDKTMLLISVSFAGACHGGYMTFIPVFVRNEFGLTHMGKILGVLTTGNALGSLFIADGVFIFFYNNYSKDGECYGPKCFMYSYMVTTMFFFINLALSFVLLKRYLQKIKNTN